MPWATLKKIFFSCCQESDEILDESSHLLIPSESVESPVIHPDVVFTDHQQLQERLGLIVRTMEGKMVNVASQIPFNLHNKVLPPERFYGSVSHSTSGSLDLHRDTDYPNHDIARHGNFYISAYNDRQADRSRSASVSSGPIAGPSSYTRCLSRTLDHPMPTPILNVRLVGYKDSMKKTRGRPRDRPSLSTYMPNPTRGPTPVEGEEGVVSTTGNAETSCEGLIAASTFKLRDVGSITLNWND